MHTTIACMKQLEYSLIAHHFADDINLILSDKSLKRINKNINHNENTTEIILFRQKSLANITKRLNFTMSGQQTERINEVKYLGLVVNEFLELIFPN